MTLTSVRPFAIAAGMAITAACASGGTSTPKTTSTPAPAPSASTAPDAPTAPRRSDRSHLNADEIMASHETNMYDVINKLRPQWFLTRGVSSRDAEANQVQVYLDGTRQDGGVQSLRQIEPGRVITAQRIDGADASTRFGMGNGAGAILINTRRT